MNAALQAIGLRIQTAATATSITPTVGTADQVNQANTQAAGTLTVNNPTGTPTDGQRLTLRITATNAQTLAFGTAYHSGTTALPTTVAAGTHSYIGFIYDAATSQWDYVSAAPGVLGVAYSGWRVVYQCRRRSAWQRIGRDATGRYADVQSCGGVVHRGSDGHDFLRHRRRGNLLHNRWQHADHRKRRLQRTDYGQRIRNRKIAGDIVGVYEQRDRQRGVHDYEWRRDQRI